MSYDIVIIHGVKDSVILPYTIESIKNHVKNFNKIYIISQDSSIELFKQNLFKDCTIIDEKDNSFFSIDNVNSIIHDIQYTIEKDQPNTSIFNETLMKILEGLNDGLIERETECQLLLLSAVCSEHILFIGPPGTGKSLIARRLSMLINGQFFERLLTKVFIFIINFISNLYFMIILL